MNDKKCGADPKACKVIDACPVGAIKYVEVKDRIKGRQINCSSGCNCGCSCGTSGSTCGGSPFARIVIDPGVCIECGLCAEQCCGKAIEMK